MEHRPGSQGRGGAGGARPVERVDPGAGGRVRLQREQVQPRDPGLAPAGIELQALHLFRRPREGVHARHGAQRRAVRDRRGEDRRPALGAEELRRQVRGPDAAADGDREVEEHGFHPPAAGDRPRLRPGLHPEVRLRPEAPSRLPDDGAGGRLGHAAPDGERLRDVRQRRVPGEAVVHHPDPRQPRRDALPGEAGGGGGGRRARPRPAQRLPDDQPHARRGALRDGRPGDVPRAPGPGGQDRHDERPYRRVVRRLPVFPRRRRVDRIRHAGIAGRERDGQPGGAADVDDVHGEGAQGRAGIGARAARGHRRA